MTTQERVFNRPFLEQYQETVGAFGNPDGKRADPGSFVEVSELRKSRGFGVDDTRIRVVVGRKGSGKTLYLRRSRTGTTEAHSVHTLREAPVTEEAEQTQLLGTRHVIKVCHWFNEAILTEAWQQLWGRAILYSVASYVLCDRRLSDYVSPEERLQLREDFRKVIGTVRKDPRSPFTAARLFISHYKGGEGFLRFLDDALWDDLEGRLAELLHRCPALYLYIDAIDEEFSHAPMYWLRCQKGLFYETMRMLRHTRLGEKLHVVITIRDLVLSSVFRSEHASRYIGDPHVRVLSWSKASAVELLEAKVRLLKEQFCFPGRPNPQTFADWIGLEKVKNRMNGIENPDGYALRHTQCLPRDVVLLGNYVGAAVVLASDHGETTLNEEEYLRIVSNLAMFSCLVQLEVSANQIRSDEIPSEASRFDFTESYLAVQEYSDQRAAQLMDLLAGLETLRIDASAIAFLEREGEERFGGSDLASVLWQNGLLGYEDDDEDVFYSLDKLGRFALPRGYENYVFHPSLREAVGLQPRGRPVQVR